MKHTYIKPKVIKNHANAKRVTAFVFLACFLVFFTFSQGFDLAASAHEREHEHSMAKTSCETCLHINNIETQIKFFKIINPLIILVVLAFFASFLFINFILLKTDFVSLTYLKIRLNN
ncbi:MAG: hypothetical protein FWG70_05060 [Oscillospiraceae bacterium]|nr:hypothetical protein [Oscillospiraceae bacterium]